LSRAVRAIQITEFGGPEVLQLAELPTPEPADGEVLIKVSRAGLNFADTHQRQDDYLAKATLPMIPGAEVAGVREDTGQRVVALCGTGGYAEYATAPGALTFPIPDGVDDGTALGLLLQGLTAWHLYRTCGRVQPGESVVVHAAAGGVGSLACQWARHLGVTVIGTCSASKAAQAKANGATHVIDYTKEDFVKRVTEITAGKKLPVVYDSVGKDTFLKSLDCLAPLGMMVSFGQSSGLVEPFSINILTGKGSLYVTRPTLAHYVPTTEKLRASAREMFDLVAAGVLKIDIGQTYPLKDAAQAHRDLEGRKTMGSTVLVV
jgi:NADPH:quinone reductase